MFKIFLAAEAATLLVTGRFAGSADDLEDGFIHLSTAHQVNGTLARHFPDKPMLFLGILPALQLDDALRLEPSRGGELFPHLYRPLVLTDVAAIVPIPERRERWHPPTITPAE